MKRGEPREYGRKHAIAELTTAELNATEDKCWELAAVACELNGDQGVYRGPAGSVKVFISFGTVKLAKSK